MSHYRAPPAVLPSLRDHMAETAAIIRDAVPDPIERGFLRWARRLDDYPFVAATLDDATREDEARRRAERVPPPWRHRPEISFDALIRGSELNFRAVGQGDRWERLTAPGKPVFA